MSLVNDMLRDLEKRNERPGAVPGQDTNVKAAQFVEEEPPSKAPRVVLWVIGLVALLATGWLIWDEHGHKLLSPPQTLEVTKEPVQPEVRATLPAKPKNDTESQTNTADQNVSPAKVVASIKLPVSAETPVSARPRIDKIQWAGGDYGGDLIVRLSDEADIQVVSQKENVIVVAFENVRLATTLPMISSALINRVDVLTEDARVLLTLSTQLRSQFVFRIDQNPTTMILGVLPEQLPEQILAQHVEPTNAPMPSLDQGVDVETEAEGLVVSSGVTELKSNGGMNKSLPDVSESVIPNEVETATEKPREPKPVSKIKSTLSESQVVERAQTLLNQGKVAQARSLLENSISERPDASMDARGMLSMILLSIGDLPIAEDVLKESLERHPQNELLKKLQARLWLQTSRYDETVSLLRQGQPDLGNDPEYHELLATAYQQQGNFEAAAQTYYRLLQRNNRVPRWWIGMGYALEQAQRINDARNAYQSGLQIPTIDRGLKQYARQRIQALAGR